MPTESHSSLSDLWKRHCSLSRGKSAEEYGRADWYWGFTDAITSYSPQAAVLTISAPRTNHSLM